MVRILISFMELKGFGHQRINIRVISGKSIRSVAVVAGINKGLLYQWGHKYKTLGYNGLINQSKER